MAGQVINSQPLTLIFQFSFEFNLSSGEIIFFWVNLIPPMNNCSALLSLKNIGHAFLGGPVTEG